MYAYIHRGDFQESSSAVSYFSTSVLPVVLFKFVHGRQELKFLIESIDQNIFTYSDEANIEVQYDWLLDERNTIKVYVLVLCCQSFGYILFGSSPFIGYIFGENEFVMLYPGWTPWTMDDLGSVAATYIYQFLLACFCFWVYYLAYVYVIFVAIEFLRQYRRLCWALSTLDRRTSKLLADRTISTSGSIWRPKYGDVFANQLCECIKHHQILVRLFRIFKSWFEVMFGAELTLGIMSFTCLFYNLLFAYNRFEFYLSLMGAAVVGFGSLFTRCLAGEIFSAMNGRIAETIFYDVNWLKLDRKNRRLICMFHFYVEQQSLDLFAFTIFKASFFTFGGIMKNTYSYFNLLRTSLSTS